MSERPPHILNASSNLLGICFIIITGLKITNLSKTTFADEISAFASLNFVMACVFSYVSMRVAKRASRYESIADLLFLVGLFALFTSVAVFYFDLFLV